MSETKDKRTFVQGILDTGITLLLSWIFGGISVDHPGKAAGLLDRDGNPVDTIDVVNLLSREGFQLIMTRMVDTFANFPPLGLVLVVMLGIGVAEYTGMISVALRLFVSKVPRSVITFSIVVAGMDGYGQTSAGRYRCGLCGRVGRLRRQFHPNRSRSDDRCLYRTGSTDH